MRTPKKPLKNKLPFKDKVKIVKSVIKTILTPKSKEERKKSKQSKSDWDKEMNEINAEFGFKKGGLIKKQDGGNSAFNKFTSGKGIKNTSWQKAPVTRTPFSVVPPTLEVSEKKSKPNWVAPPNTSSEPSRYPIMSEKKKGGATKSKIKMSKTTKIVRATKK